MNSRFLLMSVSGHHAFEAPNTDGDSPWHEAVCVRLSVNILERQQEPYGFLMAPTASHASLTRMNHHSNSTYLTLVITRCAP